MSEKSIPSSAVEAIYGIVPRRSFLPSQGCNILPHTESDHGMFGMVTALIVE